MDQRKQIRITSGELSQLWTQYMNESASICMLTYFLNKAEDQEIKEVIEFALQLSETHVETISSILTEEKYIIPHGFKLDEDVDVTAPRLFSDVYALHFVHQMGKLGLTAYGQGLSLSIRSDITHYFRECLSESAKLFEMAKDLLLSKGLLVRTPYITSLDHVDYVKDQGFLWDFLGEKRPLTVLEITNLHENIERNALGIATLIGFSQVANSKEVTKHFIRGIEIAKNQLGKLSKKLNESNLPAPMTWNSDVTNSTKFTFSEKIMMFYTEALIVLGIGFYGISIATGPRIDLGASYNKFILDIQRYAEDGANIMINNSWLEKPPQASNREQLAKKNMN